MSATALIEPTAKRLAEIAELQTTTERKQRLQYVLFLFGGIVSTVAVATLLAHWLRPLS